MSYDNGLEYSSDGRSWEQTDRFPPLYYQNWGDRLARRRPIRLEPPGSLWSTTRDPRQSSFRPRSSDTNSRRLITAGDRRAGGSRRPITGRIVEPITRIDGYILAMDNGVLRIEEPSGETSYAHFDNDGLINGTYVADSDSIRFEAPTRSKTFEFPVAVLLDLRRQHRKRVRFDVFLSADGLSWARPQTGLRAGYVEILG